MKILLATDGSPTSALALEKATELAANASSEVLVLLVSSLMHLGSYGPIVPEGTLEVPTKEEAEAILKDAVDVLKAKGISARGLRRLGSPADEILNVAEEETVDLIVLGSHGRSGLQRFLLGSVSSQVASHAPCSVFIAKQPVWAQATPDAQHAVSQA